MNDVTVVVFVEMGVVVKLGVFVRCATKETADFVGCEVGDYFAAGLELIADVLDVMGVEHAEHNFFVNCHRDIHFCTLDDSGPVLVADCMTEFY